MKSAGGYQKFKSFSCISRWATTATPPRICKWYFRVDVKRSHVSSSAQPDPDPQNRTRRRLLLLLLSWIFPPPTLRSEKATGQAALVSVPPFYKPLCRPIFISSVFCSLLPPPYSLYRHFKFSIARIFSILQAMNFLITPLLPSLLSLSPLSPKTQATIFASIFMRSHQIEVDKLLRKSRAGVAIARLRLWAALVLHDSSRVLGCRYSGKSNKVQVSFCFSLNGNFL